MRRSLKIIVLLLASSASVVVIAAPSRANQVHSVVCEVYATDAGWHVDMRVEADSYLRVVVERKISSTWWWRGRVSDDQDYFDDGPTPKNYAVTQYRVRVIGANSDSASYRCRIVSTPGLADEGAACTPGAGPFSWVPIEGDDVDYVIARDTIQGELHWRGRVETTTFSDPGGGNQIEPHHFFVFGRVGRTVVATYACTENLGPLPEPAPIARHAEGCQVTFAPVPGNQTLWADNQGRAWGQIKTTERQDAFGFIDLSTGDATVVSRFTDPAIEDLSPFNWFETTDGLVLFTGTERVGVSGNPETGEFVADPRTATLYHEDDLDSPFGELSIGYNHGIDHWLRPRNAYRADGTPIEGLAVDGKRYLTPYAGDGGAYFSKYSWPDGSNLWHRAPDGTEFRVIVDDAASTHNPRYVHVGADGRVYYFIDGELWTYDPNRETTQWLQLNVDGSAGATNPMVAGDWIVMAARLGRNRGVGLTAVNTRNAEVRRWDPDPDGNQGLIPAYVTASDTVVAYNAQKVLAFRNGEIIWEGPTKFLSPWSWSQGHTPSSVLVSDDVQDVLTWIDPDCERTR